MRRTKVLWGLAALVVAALAAAAVAAPASGAGARPTAIVSLGDSFIAATGAEFLDLRHALDGHQLCDRAAALVGPAGPAPLSAEWVRRLSFLPGSSRESLHPNAYGQRAIGACLGLLYIAPRGDYACRDKAGEFLAGMWIEALR